MSVLSIDKITAYSRVIIIIYFVVLSGLVIFGDGLIDAVGKPIGTDFLAFYAGSHLALMNDAAAAYDSERIRAVEAAVIGIEPPPLYWLYPPTYFLFVFPLAQFPYLVALAGWVMVTGMTYLFVIRKTFPGPVTVGLTLAFPGTLQNLLQGQNGFLSGALLGGGLLLAQRQPFIGGMILGLMSFKPHLAALIPIALIAGRQWRALLGAITGGCALIAISIFAFGWEIWETYVQKMLFAGQLLEGGGAPLFKVPTTFSFARMLGLDLDIARGMQAVVSFTMVLVVVWIWSRPKIEWSLKAAALATSCLLFTPSAYDYDLAILAIPIAWTAHHIAFAGRNSTHEWILVFVWVMPLVFPILSAMTNVQVGPFMLAAFLCTIVVRARQDVLRHANGRI
jgi:hypothetical protein